MHGAGVERIVAVRHAQESGALLERLVAEPRHFQQRLAVGERAIGIAMLHHVLGHRGGKASHTRQQRRGSGIHVDADRVDAVLNAGFQRARQLDLVDVVLVLAHADRLWFDLHQFGQRILQAARDGHGAAQRHVKFREFLGGNFRRGIHRRAGLAHDDLGHVEIGVLLDQLAGQLVGFARGGAVADGDQVDAVLLAQLGQLRDRFVPLLARLVRIDHVGGEQLAGRVDHGHLDAGADARIQPHHRACAGRRGQHQVLQIVAEHADRLVLGAFAHAAEQVQRQVQMQLHAPGQPHGFAQPSVGGAAAVVDIGTRGHAAFAFGVALFAVDVGAQLQLDYALVAGAHQGQQAV